LDLVKISITIPYTDPPPLEYQSQHHRHTEHRKTERRRCYQPSTVITRNVEDKKGREKRGGVNDDPNTGLRTKPYPIAQQVQRKKQFLIQVFTFLCFAFAASDETGITITSRLQMTHHHCTDTGSQSQACYCAFLSDIPTHQEFPHKSSQAHRQQNSHCQWGTRNTKGQEQSNVMEHLRHDHVGRKELLRHRIGWKQYGR
jgi:hypothetical protein